MKKKITGVIGLVGGVLIVSAFIDLGNLDDYVGQYIPSYITKDNTQAYNPLTNAGATLGRVLFYDKQMSLNGAVSCSSCHQQEFGFGDPLPQSEGFDGGLTGRHSMRIAYARFGDEEKFFWDERAASAEAQSTQPIQNPVEMGFSGTDGQPGIDSLINRLSTIPYYQTLFTFVYGDPEITEDRMQRALAQFVRSIASFDSRFDEGFVAAGGDLNATFSNYTDEENLGKFLYLTAADQGGAGCQECHRAPEFDIDPNSLNNGIITVIDDPNAIDLNNTRSPSMRDLFNPQGIVNGMMMHDGASTINQVLNHYNEVPQDPLNTNLDSRLTGAGGNLNLTATDKAALIAFMRTLSSQEIYTGARWSSPFNNDGTLDVVTGVFEATAHKGIDFELYPNPATDKVNFSGNVNSGKVSVFNLSGGIVMQETFKRTLDISNLPSGMYSVVVRTADGKQSGVKKLRVE